VILTDSRREVLDYPEVLWMSASESNVFLAVDKYNAVSDKISFALYVMNAKEESQEVWRSETYFPVAIRGLGSSSWILDVTEGENRELLQLEVSAEGWEVETVWHSVLSDSGDKRDSLFFDSDDRQLR